MFVTPFAMFLCLKDPEYIKKVLNSPNALNKSFLYKFLEWKRSLLTSDGKKILLTRCYEYIFTFLS